MGAFKDYLNEKALVKGAFHRWLGKSEDEPITAADIAKGKAAGGHAEKMAVQAQNFREEVEALDEMMPIKGHPYHTKSDAELHYIMKDAHKAAAAMQGHDSAAHMKYLDQVNDAGTVMAYRRKGGKRVTEETIVEKKTNAKELIAQAEKEASKKAQARDSGSGGMSYIEALKAALRRIKGRKNIRQTELGVKESVNESGWEIHLKKHNTLWHHTTKNPEGGSFSSHTNSMRGAKAAALRGVPAGTEYAYHHNGKPPTREIKEDFTIAEGEHEVVKHDNYGTWKKHAAAVGAEVALHGTPGVKKAVKHGHVYGMWHTNKGWMNHIGIKEEVMNETISKSADASDYIHDFVHSKNKEFKGDSKKQRIKRALGAYYHKESVDDASGLRILDELSRRTHAKYREAAKRDYGRHIRTTHRHEDTHGRDDWQAKAHRKVADKRWAGVQRSNRLSPPVHEETLHEEMSTAAHELVLHADNDSHLHHSSHMPIIANLKKKAKKGTYDSEKAKKLWKYHADRAAQSYHKAHGDGHQHWSKAFTPKDRHEAAAHWEKHHKDEVHE